MPKRSDRDSYGDVFERNPFEDMDPVQMYRELQWDNEPRDVFEIDAPEPLVGLGTIAALEYELGGAECWDEDSAPFLAVGRDSNMLYAVPRLGGRPPSRVPDFDPEDPAWACLGPVKQTDYYADKGGELGYYYHEHEAPFPTLWQHADGCQLLVPADHEGAPSYAVGKPGIVG